MLELELIERYFNYIKKYLNKIIYVKVFEVKKKEMILLECGNFIDEMKIGIFFVLDLVCYCWWNCLCKGWIVKSWSFVERVWGMEF